MARTPLTWREVAAPDFRSAAALYQNAGAGISQAGDSLIKFIDSADAKYKNEAALAFENALTQRQDPEALKRDLASGALTANINQRYLDPKMLQNAQQRVSTLLSQQSTALGNEQTNLAMEKARRDAADLQALDSWKSENADAYGRLQQLANSGDYRSLTGEIGKLNLSPNLGDRLFEQFGPTKTMQAGNAIKIFDATAEAGLERNAAADIYNFSNKPGTASAREASLESAREKYANAPNSAKINSMIDAAIQQVRAGGSAIRPNETPTGTPSFSEYLSSGGKSTTKPTGQVGNLNYDDSRKTVATVLSGSGLPNHVVSGFLGNFEIEGGYAGAKGDNGSAAGIAQWRGPRQENFTKIIGKPVSEASIEDQAKYVAWELNNPTHPSVGMTVAQRDAILNARDQEEAARLIDKYYERSDGKSTDKRVAAANAATKYLSGASTNSTSALPQEDIKQVNELYDGVLTKADSDAIEAAKTVDEVNAIVNAAFGRANGVGADIPATSVTTSPKTTKPAVPVNDGKGLNAPWWSPEYVRAANISTKTGLELEQDRIAQGQRYNISPNDPVQRLVRTGSLVTSNQQTTPATAAPLPSKTDAAKKASTELQARDQQAIVTNIAQAEPRKLLQMYGDQLTFEQTDAVRKQTAPLARLVALATPDDKTDATTELAKVAGIPKDDVPEAYIKIKGAINKIKTEIPGLDQLTEAQKAYVLKENIGESGWFSFLKSGNLGDNAKVNMDGMRTLVNSYLSDGALGATIANVNGSKKMIETGAALQKNYQDALSAYESAYNTYGDNPNHPVVQAAKRNFEKYDTQIRERLTVSALQPKQK